MKQNANIFFPPNKIDLNINPKRMSIFLAGTIDGGFSTDWQSEIIEKLNDKSIDFYNPRRKDWNNDWVTEFDNPEFFQQVSWEIDALEKATYIFMIFKANSKSPISLLELGLMSRDGKMFVVCEPGFYRKGNVDFICNKFNIPTFNTIDELIDMFKRNKM